MEDTNAHQSEGSEEKKIQNGVGALPDRLPNKVIDMIMPSAAMKMRDRIEEINIVELKKSSGGFEEVIVGDIFHPSYFWVQLRNRKEVFDQLMDRMKTFYERESNPSIKSIHRYLIPAIAYQKGLHVACIYDKKWHRGVIVKVTSDNYATVFFCDYGTVKTYRPFELYYLHKTLFGSLPAQAIRCSMYNRRPAKVAKWSQAITDEFIEKVSRGPLVADICGIDMENNSMLVSLTDKTQDGHDIQIGDWLLENNYAEIGPMCTTEIVNDICYYDQDLLVKREKEERKIEAEKRRAKDQKSKACACHYHSSSAVQLALTEDLDLDIYRTNIKLMKENIELKERIKDMHDMLKLVTLKLDPQSL